MAHTLSTVQHRTGSIEAVKTITALDIRKSAIFIVFARSVAKYCFIVKKNVFDPPPSIYMAIRDARVMHIDQQQQVSKFAQGTI